VCVCVCVCRPRADAEGMDRARISREQGEKGAGDKLPQVGESQETEEEGAGDEDVLSVKITLISAQGPRAKGMHVSKET